jgi:hypothetical protein
VQIGHALQADLLLKRLKVGKSPFADNQPFGSLRDFEIDRSSGPRKQDMPFRRTYFSKDEK